MNQRQAKRDACHLLVIWIDTNLGDGALQSHCDDLGDEDGDRLCEGMRQLREELFQRSRP